MFGTGAILTTVFTVISGWLLMSGNLKFPEFNQNEQPTTLLASATALPVERGLDGRLYITVSINDKNLRFIVDTAASNSVLREEDARAVNIKVTGRTQLRTAGGSVSVREGWAEKFNVAGTSFEDHRVLIAKDLPVSLLGMDILKTLDGFSIEL